jgi:hypothetical protein
MNANGEEDGYLRRVGKREAEKERADTLWVRREDIREKTDGEKAGF